MVKEVASEIIKKLSTEAIFCVPQRHSLTTKQICKEQIHQIDHEDPSLLGAASDGVLINITTIYKLLQVLFQTAVFYCMSKAQDAMLLLTICCDTFEC